MSAFVHFVGADVRILHRSGYIWASVAVFGLMLLVALQASRLDFAGYQDFVAALILFDVVLTPVMLVGLMVLLERDEGAFAVRCVGPAPAWAYVAARVVVVGGVALAQTLVLVTAAYDAAWSPVLLTIGLAAAAGVATLLAFMVVAFFDDLYAYVLPMIAAILALGAPGYGVLLGVEPAWLAWHPTAGALALIASAFAPETAMGLSTALISSVLWIGAGAGLAHLAIRRMQARIGGA